MERKSKKTHWTHAYLKRINSTEVTLKKGRTTRDSLSIQECPRISTVPVFFRDSRESTKKERTPDRIVNTPVRKVCYLTPNKNLNIPKTPNGFSEEHTVQSRSRKRLFW